VKRWWAAALVGGLGAAIAVIFVVRASQPPAMRFARLGGVQFSFTIDTFKLRADELPLVGEHTAGILRKRIDPHGRMGALVTNEPPQRIVVRLPGLTREQAKDLLPLITQMGRLEFRLVAKEQDQDKLKGMKAGDELGSCTYYPWSVNTEREVTGAGQGLLVVTNDGYDVTGELLSRAYPSHDESGAPVVGFEFRLEGAKRFARMTGEHIGERIAIVLNGEIYSAPVIRSQITSSGVIEGISTRKEVDMIVKVLNSGSLKAPLLLEGEYLVGPAIPKRHWW